MRCIHPSERCISSRQMTDSIFEIETTALAHVACAPQESGILLRIHTICHKGDSLYSFGQGTTSGLPCTRKGSVGDQSLLDLRCAREHWVARFSLSLPAKFFQDSTTHVEFAGAHRGHFLMARGVRKGCPASGFLFAMAVDPIFRWLQETIIPWKLDNLDFLQPAQCAYADDVAVASSSF